MHFDALRQTIQAISPGFEWIFPNRAPAIQTILDEPHAMAQLIQFIFKDSRPAFLKGKSLPRVRNDSPSQRITIDKNVMHPNASGKKFADAFKF
jgi:hypothetical protein